MSQQAAVSSAPVLVFGASGQVGQRVVQRCRADGQEVLAISRHAGPACGSAGLAWLRASLPAQVPELPPVAAVLSLGPLDLFAQWFVSWPPGDTRPPVVALSSMSAASKAASRLRDERELAARLQRAEEQLAQRADALGLAWTILRPTLLWGAGRDRSLSPIARRAMRQRWMPMPRARGLRQPVHVDDVAAAVHAAWQSKAAAGCRLECGGGERLTARDMFARVRASLARKPLAVPLPALASQVAGGLAPLSRHAAMLARLRADLVADNTDLETRLGVKPRGFTPCAGDWQPPPQPVTDTR